MKQSLDYLFDGKRKFDQDKAQKLEKQRSNLLRNRLSYEQKRNKELSQNNHDLKEELEIAKNTNNMADQEEILQISLEINALNPHCYSILSDRLSFPPKSRIDRITREITNKIPEQLRGLQNLSKIVDIYKEHNHISKSNTIHACLAVDAIYFSPNVVLNKNSTFDGLIFDKDDEILISKNIFKNFLRNPNEFRDFLNLNANKIVKAAFVFQVQPYDPSYNNFIVYIKPACNGKANEEIISNLNYIRDHLKNRNITILTYSFDGDSAYCCLHDEYFRSYINSILKNNLISFSKSLRFKVSTDFLHLIKRLRYRLFDVVIYSGFSYSDNWFNVEKLMKIFPNLPKIIWSNEIITKMHDSLPLVLFSPSNFVHLLETHNFVEAAYWMPISLSILAFNGNEIGFSNRMFLLQICFYFLVFYYEQKINTKNIELHETKKSGKNLQFYSNRILIEYLNTLHSNIQLMHKLKKFYFPRNSTGPLEHKFGCCRKRAKFIHTLNKFLQVVSIMQSIEQKKMFAKCDEFEEEIEKIHMRTESFGVLVEEKESDFYDENITKEGIAQDKPFSPQQVAKAMMFYAGFCPFDDPIVSPEDVIDYLITFVYEFIDDDLQTSKKKRKKITHRSFTLGVGQCTNGKLLTTSSAKSFQIKLSKKEFRRKLLDENIRKKFCLEDETLLTKIHYWEFIQLIKKFSENKIVTPQRNCCKEDLINWLLDHLGAFISIFHDL
ncbi:hypothetical protein M9Y10_015781 [Tritrichomonas musculus]|uniref:Uncharacterized protein n=1 Tax=Tritrichomonas musculus TaxID=1915356 RepID=A0ABR2I4W1_9EUKA